MTTGPPMSMATQTRVGRHPRFSMRMRSRLTRPLVTTGSYQGFGTCKVRNTSLLVLPEALVRPRSSIPLYQRNKSNNKNLMQQASRIGYACRT